MPERIKTYILAPTRHSPPDGPIILGNIIASPHWPEEKENEEPSLVETQAIKVDEAYQLDWKDNQAKHHNLKVGISARFLQMVGVGGDLELKFGGSKNDEVSAERMDVKWFNPTKTELNQSVQDRGVKRYLDRQRRPPPVYMITGLMILRGASATKKTMKERGIYTQVGVDLTAVSVPITIAPRIDVSGDQEKEISFGGSSDFVLAYRLTRIRVKRDGRVKSDHYTKGALYKRAPQDEDDDDQMQDDTFEIEADEMTAEALDVDGKLINDDDETIECVVLPD